MYATSSNVEKQARIDAIIAARNRSSNSNLILNTLVVSKPPGSCVLNISTRNKIVASSSSTGSQPSPPVEKFCQITSHHHEKSQYYAQAQGCTSSVNGKEDSELSDISSSGETALSKNGVANLRISEETLRRIALERPIWTLFHNYECQSSCLLGRKCKHSVYAVAVTEEINSFWGYTVNVWTTTDRRKAIISKLLSAYQRHYNQRSYFAFVLGSSIAQDRRVCEGTYLHVIGMNPTPMWKKTKAYVENLLCTGEYDQLNSKSGFLDVALNAILQTKHSSERKSHMQLERCQLFIQGFGKQNGSLSPNPGEENLIVLPVETVVQLYIEYCFQCEKESISPACKETFRVGYMKLKKDGLFKLTRGKGTFPTCDICNNANDLLANNKKLSMATSIRDLIMDLKTHHLKQQAGERTALDFKKQRAINDKDENGNPILAVIFGDGMTSYAGRTPKYGRRTGKADGSVSFENRVFGVEVYCGPVEGEILFHTDELVRGGANFIIEVQRRVLIWLGNRLSAHGMFLPTDIHLQWDNCGENKNKTAFMFNSLLVEMGYFKSITVGFLIIGHTHASIDQYFSCLRGIIRRANFIASPLALQHLFSLDAINTSPKKKKYRPPLDQIQLHYLHDYVSFFEPYRNKDIRGYGVPYQFRFTSVLGKAVCQYKQFSDSSEWLPKPPVMQNSSLEELFKRNLSIIEDHLSLTTSSGNERFMHHLGLVHSGPTYNATNVMENMVNNTHKIRDKVSDLQKALPILKKLVSDGIHEQEMRRVDEEVGISHIERYQSNNDIIGAQTTLEMTNSKEAGFLIWINYLENPTPPPLINTVKPVPINPKLIWQDFLKTEGSLDEIEKAQANADKIVNLQADLETNIVEKSSSQTKNICEGNSSESDGDDDYAKVLQTLRQTKEVKSKLAKAKTTKAAANDRQVVMNAVASIKATARYMLEKKIASKLVQYTGKTSKELGHGAYWNKIVSTEDMNYFEARTSVEDILNIVDLEIQSAPEFEWLPPRVLTSQQQLEKVKRDKENAEQFAQYGQLYKDLLCRKGESGRGETVGRTTADQMIKRHQKIMSNPKQSKSKKKEHTSTDDIKTKSKQVNKRKSDVLKKLETENEALQIEYEQKRNADLKSKLSGKRKVKKTILQDDDESSSASSADSDSTFSTKVGHRIAPVLMEEHHTVPAEEIAKESKVDTSDVGDMMFEESSANYFLETTLVTTTASESNIKVANLYIAKLKKMAQSVQQQVNCSSSKFRGRNKGSESETFLVNLKLAVYETLNFPTYKSNYLTLPELFGVHLRNNYSIDQLSKETVRKSFLSDLVDATVHFQAGNSTTSSIVDVPLSSILKTIMDYKIFELPSYNNC